MEIPFKSLRYSSSDIQKWGINFQRNIRRTQEIATGHPLAESTTYLEFPRLAPSRVCSYLSNKILSLRPMHWVKHKTGAPE